jgi:Icc protein
MKSICLVQLSDLHLGAEWGGVDPLASLAVVVESVDALEPKPDAVLVTGDLAEHASDAEYEQVRASLAPLNAPLYVLPGNHDDRGALRRHFAIPGSDDQAVQYSADIGPLRLIALDSMIPGQDSGALGPERLAWLDAALGAAPERATMIALHHVPLATGVPALDEVGLAAADRSALAEILGRHPQVQRVVAGHVHRPVTGVLGGRTVLAIPSTYMQARLGFGQAAGIDFESGPSGFALHMLLDGQLVSHVEYAR